MYFFLSKTIGDLGVPSKFILLLFVCGLLLRSTRYARLGRRLAIAGVVLALIVGFTPIGTALLVPLENRFPRWDETHGPPAGVIVLGGIVNTYVSVRRNEISLDSAADRLIAAVELQRRYPALRVVFTSGDSNLIFKGRPESGFAVRFLRNLGVPSGNIAFDDAARNTLENAINAKKIADPKSGETWLLVTSAAHMPRAMGIFRAAGFPVEAFPVDYRTGGWRDLKALPPLSLLGGFYRLDPAIHEWEGLFVDWISGRTPTLFPAPANAAS